MSGLIMISPSPSWGGCIAAQRRDGWGQAAWAAIPHPSRFAAHPPYKGEGE